MPAVSWPYPFKGAIVCCQAQVTAHPLLWAADRAHLNGSASITVHALLGRPGLAWLRDHAVQGRGYPARRGHARDGSRRRQGAPACCLLYALFVHPCMSEDEWAFLTL